MSDEIRVHLPNPAATWRLGRALGRLLQAGDVVGLDGPLGAGKTSLVQGLARGLGVPEEVPVSSPTFTLLNEYRGRVPLCHADLYRLDSEEELAELGLWEAAEAGGVLVVEWLGRFPQAAPPDRLQVALAPDETGAGRWAQLSAQGPRSGARLLAIRAALAHGQRRGPGRTHPRRGPP